MRINKLHIDGFGVYHDYSKKMDSPLTVFYGPNEAGKSTLLAFIRTVLYGFPLSNAKQWYPPQSGGEHGGRLVIANDAGDMFTVERHRGPRGGPLVVRLNGTEKSNGPQIVEQLCGQQPRSVFENVLSFNLGELPEVGSKKGKTNQDITSQFYTAAIGANRLQEAVANLQKRRQDIYTTTRANQKRLMERLNRLEVLDTHLRKVEGQSADYADTTRRIAELTTLLHSSEEQEKTLLLQREELMRYVDSWSHWCELVKLESTLPAEIPDDDFPDNPIPRLETLEATIEKHQDTVETLAAMTSETEVQANCVVPYETLIDAKAQCEALVKGEEKHQSACADLQRRQDAVKAKQDEVTETLRTLGPHWTKEQVEVLDISVTQMAQVDEWKTNFDTGHERSKTLETDLDNVEASYREQELSVTKLENDIDPGMGDELEAKVALIEKALTCKEAHTSANEALVQALQNPSTNHRSPSEHQPSRWLELTIGALSLSAIALAGWFELLWLGLMGVVGLGYGVLAWSRRDKSQDTSTPKRAAEEAKVKNTHQAYKKAVGRLEFSDPDSVEVSDLTKRKERLTTEIRNRKASTDARSVLKTLEDQTATQREAKEKHESLIDEQKAKWRAWLTLGYFPDTLPAGSMEVFVEKVKTARQVLDSLKAEENRLYGITQDIKEYRQQVQELAERHDIPLDDSIADATIWTEQIKKILTTATEKQAHWEKARNTLPDLKRQYQTANTALKRDSDKKGELLKAAKAKDVEEFRRKANEWRQMQNTISRREEKRVILRTMWRDKHTDEELTKMFQDRTERDLKDELNCLDDSLGELRTSRNDNTGERGKLEGALAKMDGDGQASEAREEREVKRTQANELAEEWSTLMVAQWLLEQARRKYENERQPAVIQSASIWFTKMTDGRYAHIVPPADGTSEFSVVDRRERTKTPSQLSRGTQDQLYLALRFGLLQSLGHQAEQLPVIVDEALVNCDPDRAKVAASAFTELARTNQVLVMTCHPWMRDLFLKASHDVRIVELESEA